MVQLTDDCFAIGDGLLTVEQAAALIVARVPVLMGQERLPLPQAVGRVLAEPLLAPRPLPLFSNSAVDGYAFRHADYAAMAALPLQGRVPAGQAPGPLAAGTAMRIFTGAPLPQGADTVMMQEDAREAVATDGRVLVHLAPGLKRGANARPAGEDVAEGAEALPAGCRLRAADIGLVAALGIGSLGVRPKLRVGVFSTGDELASPGEAVAPAQSFDSNRFTVMALLQALPVEVTDLGILPDAAAATTEALRAAATEQDLLLTSGGVSQGEEDHVRAAIEAAGRLVFWRMAIKPGRPAAMGVVAGTPVLGLPGNPVAAVVSFLHLARPLVLRMAGALAEPLPRFAAQADFSHRKKPGRREYLRAHLLPPEAVPSGQPPVPLVRKFHRDGAALLSSLTASDAFVELSEDVTTVAPGDWVTILPFAGIM